MTAFKRKSFTLKEKIDIVCRLESGEKNSRIAKRFGVSHSTISTIYKHKEQIKSSMINNSLNIKRVRGASNNQLDHMLLHWFKEQRNMNIPLSGSIMHQKANSFAVTLGLGENTISSSWIQRFRTRYDIVFGKVCDERNAGAVELSQSWLSDVWPLLCTSYSADDIFYADEIGLFFNLTPNNSFKFKGEKCSNGELSKERLTVLMASNISGTCKKQLLVIGKPKNPSCFKNVHSLPVEYEQNKNAWMTSFIFEKWIREWDKRLQQEARKICLIVDNCPAHPYVERLENIDLQFLPPNITTVLQPLDQGIIISLKSYYRKLQVSKILQNGSNGRITKLDILDSILMLADAWNSVKPSTIFNDFHQTGFIQGACTEEKEDNIPLAHLMQLAKISTVPNDLLHVDDELHICEALNDEDFWFATDIKAEVVDEIDDNDGKFESPSVAEACMAVHTLQKFLYMNENFNSKSLSKNLSSFASDLNTEHMHSKCNYQTKMDYFCQ